MTLKEQVLQYNAEMKTALQTMYEALNKGQQKQIVKNEKVKALFERFGIEVSDK